MKITVRLAGEKYIKTFNPKNKIIIIFNHGQNTNDTAKKKECVWAMDLKNQASLVDEEINGKKIRNNKRNRIAVYPYN